MGTSVDMFRIAARWIVAGVAGQHPVWERPVGQLVGHAAGRNGALDRLAQAELTITIPVFEAQPGPTGVRPGADIDLAPKSIG